jgi:hypothetical protein
MTAPSCGRNSTQPRTASRFPGERIRAAARPIRKRRGRQSRGGPGRRSVSFGCRLVHRFDDVPPYRLNCLVTLRRKVGPGLRLVECLCLLKAIPLRKCARGRIWCRLIELCKRTLNCMKAAPRPAVISEGPGDYAPEAVLLPLYFKDTYAHGPAGWAPKIEARRLLADGLFRQNAS